jgi:hypothetical protein
MSRAGRRSVLVVGALLMMTVVFASAQQQTTSTATKNFEVITVAGNDLVVKLPEGTRQLTVPDDFRFTVDGQQMSVRELKPGMKGTATITTKTTLHPVSVTEVKNGTVRQVTGSTILVQTNEGFRSFTQGEVDKRGVKIVRDGKPIELAELRSGDSLTATIVTTKPPRVVTEKEVQATLARAAPAAAPSSVQAPAPPTTPPAAQTAERPSATTGSARKLPKTASPLPLVALVGVVSLATGLGLRLRRRRLTG